MSDIHLSEIFPITVSSLKLVSFRLSPQVSREIGNSLSWHFSKQFPGVVVIWCQESFWILARSDTKIPLKAKWEEALEAIQEKIKDKIGDRIYYIQRVSKPVVDAEVIAQLAVRILKINCRFTSRTVLDENKVKVKRECDFWAETFEVNSKAEPAITLTPRTRFLYNETLDVFFDNHPYRNDPEKLLTGLLVRDIESGSTATLVEISGSIGELREQLIEKATGSVSREKLHSAPDEQPVVSVKFSKNSHPYDYAMAALRPCITPYTASKFELEYGALLRKTKITTDERKQLLSLYKQDAHQVLVGYGLKLEKQCINSGKQYPGLFWKPSTKLEDTLLLFGNGVTSTRGKTLLGLYKGGVYRLHKEFLSPARKIRAGILNFTNVDDIPFARGLQEELNKHKNNKFKIGFAKENIRQASLEDLSTTEAKVKVETLVDEVSQVPVDLVLVFPPQSDRAKDDSDGDSIYAWVYRRLLRRRVASQIIYEKTLREQSRFVYQQVVPGILAKLGNLPFVLAEPLSIADRFIGLDISRRSKKNGKGSINACASVRLYDNRGEFIRYQIANDSLAEGEEIPGAILQDFFPIKDFKNKKVLIYRDGLFRGDEIKNLVAWGRAIGSEFIFVECIKSQIPRLYNVLNKKLQHPTRGLTLFLSPREAILVTTQVPPKIGLPRPLRLRVREEGASVDIKILVDATLKLTLLHHGSLKDPRLPIPLFGADRIAYRRLQGIYPGELEGDKQYWL